MKKKYSDLKVYKSDRFEDIPIKFNLDFPLNEEFIKLLKKENHFPQEYYLIKNKIIMDLSKIMYISGKPGLYKIVGNNKSSFIVESLLDGKRSPVFLNNKISPLSDIVVVTVDGQVHVEEVFKNILKEYNGQKIDIDTNNEELLFEFMNKMLPNWDREAVTNKDIKKIIQWYNLLIENAIITIEDLKEEFEDQKDEKDNITEEDKENDSENADKEINE